MIDLNTRQAELEYESVLLGQHRYEAARARGESATAPGKEQTKLALDALATAIKEFSECERGAGRLHHAIPYLAHILPEQAAYLTIRHAIDGAALNQKASTVTLALGTAIEDHLNLVSLGDEAPGLYRKVMEQVRKSTSERHRKGVLRHVMHKYLTKEKVLSWSDSDKMSLGLKLIELFDQTCNIITIRRQTEGHHNTPVRVVFTEGAAAWMQDAHAIASTWYPVHLPMLVPPRDWTSPWSGGYITKAIRRATMVQSHLPGALQRLKDTADLTEVYSAVNSIQRTPWRINKAMATVIQEAWGAGPRYQDLLVEAERPLPARPAGLPERGELTVEQREALTVWKRDAAMVYEFNARQRSKKIAVEQKLWVAEKFKEELSIYFPHYLDFRGRIYPFASYLNPQSSDDGRALLEFAEGKPLGEAGLFWLKVHIANLFGIDKVTFEEREAWTDAHIGELMASATNPLDDHGQFWTTADGGKNRWQALAACMELTGALVQGANDYVSHLPIAMDGSCSGLQHYSAMLRDPSGGAAVNLVPADKPGDIYTEVARRAQALSDSSTSGMADVWRARVVRKVAKQPTMTLCYSATIFGMQEQIAKAVSDLGGEDYLDGVDVRPACVYMAQIIWEAIGDTVVAAKEAMKFLKQCSRLAAKVTSPATRQEISERSSRLARVRRVKAKAKELGRHEAWLALIEERAVKQLASVRSRVGEPICWTAPSGFRVEQGYREVDSAPIKLHYKGVRVRLFLSHDTERLDQKKQAAGVAPNFVHSLDSAHLMATVNVGTGNGLTNWACIHDSFGVHAADVDVLHACVREAFIEQYTPNVLEQFREEIIALLPPELAEKVPPVPAQGTLDLAAVRESRYFFA